MIPWTLLLTAAPWKKLGGGLLRICPYLLIAGIGAVITYYVQGYYHAKEIAGKNDIISKAEEVKKEAVSQAINDQFNLCESQKEITERAGYAYQDRISKLESDYNIAVKRLRERPTVQRCIAVSAPVHTGRADAGADTGQHGQSGVDGESILQLGRDGQRNGETLAELQKFICDVYAMNGKKCKGGMDAP